MTSYLKCNLNLYKWSFIRRVRELYFHEYYMTLNWRTLQSKRDTFLLWEILDMAYMATLPWFLKFMSFSLLYKWSFIRRVRELYFHEYYMTLNWRTLQSKRDTFLLWEILDMAYMATLPWFLKFMSFSL